MREIVSLQIGKAGNAVGMKFWEEICMEHGIDPCGNYKGINDDQLEKIDAYFDRSRKKRHTLRAIAVDLDTELVEQVTDSPYGALLNSHNLHTGSGGTGSNWARGYFTEGRLMAPDILDSLRREAEKCECLQGFQIVHSIAGGTGSGLGTLIMEKMAEFYPKRSLSTFTVIQSPNIFDDRTETYNAVIALHYLTQMYVETFCMDNRALERICEQALAMPKPGYENLNYLISTAMSFITSSLRLPGRLNNTLWKSSINMIPFPRLHYLVPGLAPLVNEGCSLERPITVEQLTNRLLNPENTFIYPFSTGKYLTANYIYRGDFQADAVGKYTSYFFRKNSLRFVDWLPENAQAEVCTLPVGDLKRGAAVVGNTTAVTAVFKRLMELFDSIHKGRKYTRWFTDAGMCIEELDEAGATLRDVIDEYRRCEEAAYDDVWHDPKVDWGGFYDTSGIPAFQSEDEHPQIQTDKIIRMITEEYGLKLKVMLFTVFGSEIHCSMAAGLGEGRLMEAAATT